MSWAVASGPHKGATGCLLQANSALGSRRRRGGRGGPLVWDSILENPQRLNLRENEAAAAKTAEGQGGASHPARPREMGVS